MLVTDRSKRCRQVRRLQQIQQDRKHSGRVQQRWVAHARLVLHESGAAGTEGIYLWEIELNLCCGLINNDALIFSGDGRWRQVIRRCASVADTGVTGVCNWGVYENGVYWEECYCAEDSCNSAISTFASLNIIAVGTIVAYNIAKNLIWLESISIK